MLDFDPHGSRWIVTVKKRPFHRGGPPEDSPALLVAGHIETPYKV